MSTDQSNRFRSVSGWLGQVAAWVVIGAVAVALVIAVLVPRLAGATPYTILTGSMRPGMPPGTLVVVKPVDAESIGVGTVITYQLESGKPTVVTHRVVGASLNGNGTRTLITQGDANNTPDAQEVLPVQIKGKLWYSVPYLGYLNRLMTGNQRQMAVYGAAAVLLAYAAYMLIGSLQDRSSSRRREGVEQ